MMGYWNINDVFIAKASFFVSKIFINYKSCNDFYYKDNLLKLFEHPFNCGSIKERMTERGLEIAIAEIWLNHYNNCIEVGAVTPYYLLNKVKRIIDPRDKHKEVTDHKSLFDVNLHGGNIISISTVEHVGLGEYGLTEKKNSVQAIKKIFMESKHCLITFPVGHNPKLDFWTKKHLQSPYITLYTQGRFNNKWKICSRAKDMRTYGPLWANSVIIIEK